MDRKQLIAAAIAAAFLAASSAHAFDDDFGGTRSSTPPAHQKSTTPPSAVQKAPTPPKADTFGSTRKEPIAQHPAVAPRKDTGATNRAFDTARDRAKSHDVAVEHEKSLRPPVPAATTTERIPVRKVEKPTAPRVPDAAPVAAPVPTIDAQAERRRELEAEERRTRLERERVAARKRELDDREAEMREREEALERQRRMQQYPPMPLPLPPAPPVVVTQSAPPPVQAPVITQREPAMPMPMPVPTKIETATEGGSSFWGFFKISALIALVVAAGLAVRRFFAPIKSVVETTRAEAPESSAPRADRSLPLGAEIGSAVSIKPATFVGVGLLGSIAEPPPNDASRIVAVSSVVPEGWSDNQTIHRFYLSTGDNPDATERFIQVFSEGTIPTEIVYFTRLRRVFITDEEKRQHYTGESPDGIGTRAYVLPRAALQKVLSPEMFAHIGDAPELEFIRAIGGDDEKIDMIRASERRIDDPYGERGLKQETRFMPYTRAIGEGEGALVEHLLISYEEPKGDRTGMREVHVDFMIGIPIDAADVMIA